MSATDADEPVTPPVDLPGGRTLKLPDRGTTRITETGPSDAPVLFLLHGWMATADLNWFACYSSLARDFHVVAIDHRGHGRGIKSRRRFRLADCADDVAAVIDLLDLDPVIATGYSMGGPVAQLLWHRHPGKVRGLVMCATAQNFGGSPRARAIAAAFGGAGLAARAIPKAVRQTVRERVAGARFDADSPEGRWARSEFMASDGRMLTEAGGAIGRFSSSEWIGGVDVPTAVLVTELDRIVPPQRQVKLARAIPGASIHPVFGDHVVCAADPAKFVATLHDACLEVADRSREAHH